MDDEHNYRHPISFGDRMRELDFIIQEKMTRSLLDASESSNVTEFLVNLIYGTNFQTRLQDAKVVARGPQILELADALEPIQWYGNFRGPALACQLQYLYHRGYLAEARFGREKSPVVYLKPSYWNQQTQGNLAKVETVKSLMRLKPNHLESNAYEIGAWWG